MQQPLRRPAPPLFLGIECGGTHSTAILADARQKAVQEMTLGPANLRLLSDRQLTRFLKQIQARVPAPCSIAIGMAGARTDSDRNRIRQAAGKLWKGIPCQATNDLETALAAASLAPSSRSASSSPPAATVLVLSGTGSCCWGRHKNGATARMGGWGHVLGDKGSGYEIGLRSLKAVLYYYDRDGQWPALGSRLLRALQLNEPEDFVGWSLQAGKAEIAALAIEVFQAAARRDRIAADILTGAAHSLAGDACACARRLVRKGTAVRFVLSGSVLLRQPGFARQVARLIRSAWPGATVQPLQRSGAWGACLMAQQARGLPDSPRTRPARALPSLPVQPDPERNLSPTEQRHPRSMDLDKMSIRQAVELMLNEETVIPKALQKQSLVIEKAVRQIALCFRRQGRLFYVGAGTSGRLGVLDASECPPTFQSDPEQVQGIIAGGVTALWKSSEEAEDDPAAGARAVAFRGIKAPDVVVGIAASGRTPFVWGALREAARRGAFTILICFNPHQTIPPSAKPGLVINPSLGPEILTGSTRLKAGTATKLLLNMFTTLAMVQAGKTISNLMVDVKASNSKLRDRAVRIVGELTRRDQARCREMLEKTKWNIKEACRRLGRTKPAKFS